MRKILYTLVLIIGVALGWFAGTNISNMGHTNTDTDLQSQITQKEAQITELQESVNNYQTQLSHYTQDQELTNDLILDALVATNSTGGQTKEGMQERLSNNQASITINQDHTAIFKDESLDHPIYIKLIKNNLLLTTDTSNNDLPTVTLFDTISKAVTTINFHTLQEQALSLTQATTNNP